MPDTAALRLLAWRYTKVLLLQFVFGQIAVPALFVAILVSSPLLLTPLPVVTFVVVSAGMSLARLRAVALLQLRPVIEASDADLYRVLAPAIDDEIEGLGRVPVAVAIAAIPMAFFALFFAFRASPTLWVCVTAGGLLAIQGLVLAPLLRRQLLGDRELLLASPILG